MKVRVVLAEDQRMMREGLRSLLEGREGITVVGEAENGRQAVEMAREELPDIVIMDMVMPEMNGVEAARRIGSAAPGTRVIALSSYGDPRMVRDTLRAGAAGYVLKDCATEDLLDAIDTVMAGRPYFSPQIAGVVLDGFLRPDEAGDGLNEAGLTAREREVLQLVAEGRKTKEIAALLGISSKTVEKHRERINEKTGLKGIAELTRYAIKHGMVRVEK